ncbi:MAG: SPOR domain-containing protein [Ignavibacterium sp.]|nr:MAG: SPOR domain-containing protein [Ignavibacterium sp.]
MKHLVLSFLIINLLLFLQACSASTDTRYETENDHTDVEPTDTVATIQEDFDITPYRIQIEIEDSDTESEGITDVWYQYESLQDDSISGVNGKIIGTVDGYRVMVLVTDNMEEANSVRDEVSSRISRRELYISFEPPFYKVKIGDFTNIAEANDLKFKLSQLGYTHARVVQETVNLFE